MNKPKTFVFLLLSVMLIIPLALAVAPAVRADPEEAQGQPEAALQLSPPPDVVGCYYMKGRVTGYDWLGKKFSVSTYGLLLIPCQGQNPCDWHKVEIWWIFTAGPDGAGVSPYLPQAVEPPMEKQPGSTCPVLFYDGWIGSTLQDANGKVKNKPRLSMAEALGTYNTWPTPYYINTLNAYVSLKYDKVAHTNVIKSIKGTATGWGEWGGDVGDNSPQFGQYQFKFTATPVPCT